MKKLMFALAGAVAMAGVASATPTVSDWFATGIKDYTAWPASETQGAWSNTDAGELKGETDAKYISFDAEDSAPLTFTVNNGLEKTIGPNTSSVIVKSKVSFTPFAVASLGDIDVPTGAKGGVIVVKAGDDSLSYYVLAKKDGAMANEWVDTKITATADATLVTITVAEDTTVEDVKKITYAFGEGGSVVTTSTYDIVITGATAADKAISSANYSGCGEVASLEAQQVQAAFMLDYGTLPTGVASVTVTVGGIEQTPVSGNKYRINNGDTAVATFVAAPNYVLNNANPQEVTPTQDITYTAADFPVHADKILAYIGETAYTNLQLAANAVQNDGLIKLANYDVSTDIELFFVEKTNVVFDLNGHTVTTTEGSHSLAVFGGSLTITNGVWYKSANSTAVIVGKTATDGSYEPKDTRGLPYTEYWNKAYDGQLTIAAGATLKGTTGSNVIKANNGAKVIVDGGTLTSVGPAKQVAIKVAGEGTVATIKAGIIDGALSTETSGSVVINAASAMAANSTFVADYTAMLDSANYKMQQNGDVWTIVAKSFIFYIGDKGYETWSELATDLKSGDTVRVVAAVTAPAGYTIAAGVTFQLDGGTLTVAAENTMTVAGTFKCDATGSDFVNNGTLVLNAGATVYMGETKWVGTDAVFANVTAGSINQKRSTTAYGNDYVISENGAVTIYGSDFPAFDDTYTLTAGSVLTTAIPEATVLAKVTTSVANHHVAKTGENTYGVVPNGFIFTLTATGVTAPKYTIGETETAFAAGAGEDVWVTEAIAEGTTFTVSYTTTNAIPSATWSQLVNVSGTAPTFVMGNAAASATLVVIDAGDIPLGPGADEKAADAIEQAAAKDPNVKDASVVKAKIADVGGVAAANWIKASNGGVTYAAIEDAAKADVETSCVMGTKAIVENATVTLTEMKADGEAANTFDIKVKLTSGASTGDAIAYAKKQVEDLFQATYSLDAASVDWSASNVEATAEEEPVGNEVKFSVAPKNDSAPAAFIRLKIK